MLGYRALSAASLRANMQENICAARSQGDAEATQRWTDCQTEFANSARFRDDLLYSWLHENLNLDRKYITSVFPSLPDKLSLLDHAARLHSCSAFLCHNDTHSFAIKHHHGSC